MSPVEFGDNVRVEYEGTLAKWLEWNTPVLRQFANTARLQTPVVITAGETNERKQIESMGDTLVWKRVKSPMDLFARVPRSSAQDPLVEIIYLEGTESMIKINHRVITGFVQEKSKGPFEKELFVASVDSSVKAGLGMLLALEKRNLTVYATLAGSLEVVAKSIELSGAGVAIGSIVGLSYLSYLLAKGDMSNSLLQLGMLNNFASYFFVRSLEFGSAIVTAFGTISLAEFFWATKSERNRSTHSTESPLSHIKDFVAGYRILTNSRLRTVSLSQDIITRG